MSGKVVSGHGIDSGYLAHQLSQLGAPWLDTDGGASRGRIQVVMDVIDMDPAGERSISYVHVHFGFILREYSKLVWDCVVCNGGSVGSALGPAVDIWCSSMGRALVELLRQDGAMANRYRPSDTGGIPGWHSVVPPASARFSCDPRLISEAFVRDSLLRFQQSLSWDVVSAALVGADPHESYGVKWIASDFGDGLDVRLEIDGSPVQALEVTFNEDVTRDLARPFILRQNAIALFRGTKGMLN